MNRYTDLNKNTFFVNKEITRYRRKPRKKPEQINYQYRYYALIFFFFLFSFGYVAFKINQTENSIFKEVYQIFFPPNANPAKQATEISSPKNESPAILKEEDSNASSPDNSFRANPAGNETAQSPVYQNEILFSFYLPKFSKEKNSVNFIPLPQSIKEGPGNPIKNIMLSIFRFKTQNTNLKNFFSPQIKLLGALVENQTLILNFNKYFENSKFGYKGLEIRLQQILWTMLNLDADILGEKISFVSIIIEGERKDKLGGDGILLKPFYSQQDLKKEIVFE